MLKMIFLKNIYFIAWHLLLAANVKMSTDYSFEREVAVAFYVTESLKHPLKNHFRLQLLHTILGAPSPFLSLIGINGVGVVGGVGVGVG